MKKLLLLLFAFFTFGWALGQNGFQKITISDTISEIARPYFADFNNDGLIDVVVNDFYNLRILLYTQNADHTFSSKVAVSGLASNPRCVAAYDFNGDTAVDIAAIVNDNFYVFFNDGNNSFTRSTNLYDGKVSKLELIDYNNDGNMDLIGTANYQYYEFVHIYKNNGNETFTTVDPGYPGDGTDDVVVADFDNDGNEDFAVITFYYLIAYKNNGDGSFTKFYIDTLYPESVDAYDFNGDSLPELVVYSSDANFSNGYIVVYENKGNFAFKEVYNSGNVSAYNGYAKAGDFNKDGLVDIAFATNNARDFQWLKNTGNYNFTKLYVTGDISSPVLSRCDLDQDGKLDILVGTYGATYWLKNKHLFPVTHFPPDTVVCGGSHLQLSVSEPDADSIVWYGIYGDTTIQLTENMGMTGVYDDTLTFYKDARPDSVLVFAKLMNNYDITAYSDTINIKNESNAPVLSVKSITVYINAYGYGIIDKAGIVDTAYDECGLLDTVLSVDTVTCDDIGDNTITVILTDASGNTTTSTVSVTVADTINPVLSCKDSVTFSAGPNNLYTVQGSELDATASDNCTITLTNNLNGQNTLADYQLPAGDTTIIWTATDAAGNQAVCTTYVYVNSWASVVTQEGFRIYPNPAKDRLTINAQFSGELLLTDLQGKVLIKQKIQPGVRHINIKPLRAGIYLLQIKSQKTNTTVQIIKY